MGNALLRACGSKKEAAALPIETSFAFPAPIPSWPSSDGGFAKGIIDIGGLEVCQVTTFSKVWSSLQGGQDDLGATFFKPSPIPSGFSMLGYYAQPNNRPLFGHVLVARDVAAADRQALARPLDYTLIWSSQSASISQEGNGYFWLPAPPEGYKAAGLVVTGTPEKPPLDEVRCVRSELADACESEAPIWSDEKDGFSVASLRPAARGIQCLGVHVGTFMAQTNGSLKSSAMACLKNTSSNYISCMPNLAQIDAILKAYSPYVYLHPNEPYLPSSVPWFFDNGALLYQKGNPSPTPVTSNGSNLPQGGGNDGEYWLDLPLGDDRKEKVRKGDLASARVYVQAKPMLGATATDLAMWFFYPFNGPARAKVAFFTIPLGKIGEHVGDWEHLTLRVSNFSGELWRVYYSEHSSGTWLDASQVAYEGGNKPVAYSSLHGHAFYSKEGLVLQGDSRLGIGIRNDSAKGSKMDTGEGFDVVSGEYLGAAVAEPPWLGFEREWGPKTEYDIGREIDRVARILPKSLREKLKKLVSRLPAEVLGEEGPTGPKAKSSWRMDER